MAKAGVREFFDSKAGKVVAGVLVLVAAIVFYLSLKSNLGEESIATETRNRIYMDAATGKSFTAELQNGWTVPIPAPSGSKTGFPAEMCGWTRDGKVRSGTVPVLLNQYANKPGPTFCPDCGRLVVERNPVPGPNDTATAPPTEAEYRSKPDRG